jgi:hypothetical protein
MANASPRANLAGHAVRRFRYNPSRVTYVATKVLAHSSRKLRAIVASRSPLSFLHKTTLLIADAVHANPRYPQHPPPQTVINWAGERIAGNTNHLRPKDHRMRNLNCLTATLALSFSLAASAQQDPYERYVNNSDDFKAVKQEKAWCQKAFPSWTYMPWTYQWTPGYTDASGRWSLQHGYNGAFVDHGDIATADSPTGRLDWIDRFKLRFYVDHLADKHYLHLWDGGDLKPHLAALHSAGVRTAPLNGAMFSKLQEIIRHHIGAVKASPFRAAYALDDEISWGHFLHPTMWCVTDDHAAYANWLKEIYGPDAPHRSGWITYDDLRPKLNTWSIGTFDASPLMDQWTFNDSYWNNFVGRLVEYSNEVDPATPCGFVGGQAPNAFGGYDYAKVMRKIQFIEAYNMGSSQAIIRSFNPHNAIPAVTSHFHKSADDDIWQTWYYLAHGNRGFIGWVEGWFDGDKPKPWHDLVAPTYLEANNKIGPLMAGTEWLHDGVAIYYSHSSIQLGWIMDAEAHGKTWTHRNGDERLGSSHQVRKAWENMLRDSGIQYNFISYVDVIQKGVPAEYKVLILPAAICLSDAEARRIEEFCRNGGTVIADYMPGLWDQHGKGRAAGGALDAMFAVHHDPAIRQADVFGGSLWCEINQDANFSWKTYHELMTNQNACIQDESGFDKAVRKMNVNHVNPFGKGTAVLMNLSPQWYNAYRDAGAASAAKREIFIRHVTGGGARPWVQLSPADDHTFGHEITYWTRAAAGQPARTIVFVCLNPEVSVTQLGGGNAAGLKTERVKATLRFAAEITDVRDERTGKPLGTGKSFDFEWKQNEAIVISFAGSPPGRP